MSVEHVLQMQQFFRERLARAEARHKENGHADSDSDSDDSDDNVREVAAHQNVFQRP